MWLSLLLACKPNLENPQITIETLEAGYVLGSQMGDEPMAFVVDESGDMIWSLEVDIENLSPAIEPSRDNESILYNMFAEDRTIDIGVVYEIPLNGEPATSLRTEWAHHTFTDLPDGTLAYLALDIRETEDHGPVVGDRIIELYPDGGARQVFTSWEHIPVTPHENWDSNFYPQGHDWIHFNALHYDVDKNSYLVSSRNLNCLMEIDRDSGQILQIIGGDLSDYEVVSDGPQFLYPHGVRWTGPDTLMFTASNEVDGDWMSWAMELELDPVAGTATEIWSYGREEGIYAYALGEARRLHNGNTLINWGGAGIIREVTPEGDVVWEYGADIGNFYGHTSFLPDHF